MRIGHARVCIVGIWWLLLICMGWYIYADRVAAQVHIESYRDTLSTSAPGLLSNHTLEFTTQVQLPPGARFQLTPPSGFSVVDDPLFGTRNVELYVNGTARPATGTSVVGYDEVEITTGSPGQIRYTLDPTLSGIPAYAQLELRVGNHTASSAQSYVATTTTATTTSTTTVPGDIPGIENSTATGTHRVNLRIYEGTNLLARAGFVVWLIEQVTAGPADTRLTYPTILTEGQPDGNVSGDVRAVEVSVRSDRFAICRYATEPGVEYEDMSGEFDREDFWVFHTFTIDVNPDTDYTFYVRCNDPEDNINDEDYEISFYVTEEPAGEPDPDGDIDSGGTGGGDGQAGEGDGGSASGPGAGDEDTEDEPASSPGGGSGGGGGGGSGTSGTGAGGGFEDEPAPFESGDARIIINGFAYPGSEVVILVDSVQYDQTTANADGRYDITIDGIARGVYTFGVYSVDNSGTRSSTFSTSFTVTGARTSSLSNINVPPSVAVNPDPVDPGQDVTFSGYALPDADITIEHETEGSAASRQTFTTTSGADGAWSYTADTSSYPPGPHRLRVRAEQPDGARTNFSNYIRYGVGEDVGGEVTADLNQDGRVDLIDFSILLFWWETDGGDSNPPADINQDGIVNLIDFSILLFNWTG